MADSRRVVLIGKSGSGKSSLANTLFGEAVFRVNHSSSSKSKFSDAQSRTVKGLDLTLIDTPGIFNTDRSDEDVQCEIFSCLTQSAPGPHAVLFVLLVEKFTEQEQSIVEQMGGHFGEGVFRHTTVVFTHGDQLQEGTEIGRFVSESQGLRELVRKCGGRCHVIDNKYWKSSQDPYRSNSVQVEKILQSIQTTIEENNGGFFTNEMLIQVEESIKLEQNRTEESRALSLEESRAQAKVTVLQKYISAQTRRRYVKYLLIGGLPLAAFLMIVPIVVGYFRGRALSGTALGVNAVPPPSVMEVVQEVVAPIKTSLDYIIETIQAVFTTERSPLNKTLTEFE